MKKIWMILVLVSAVLLSAGCTSRGADDAPAAQADIQNLGKQTDKAPSSGENAPGSEGGKIVVPAEKYGDERLKGLRVECVNPDITVLRVEFTKPEKPTGSDDWGIRALYLYEGDLPAYIRADYKSQNVSLFEHSWDGPDGYFVFRKGDMRWVSCNYTGQGVRLGEDLPTLRIFSHEAVAPRVEGLDYFQQIKLNYVGGFPDNEKFIDLNRIVYDKDWNVVTCELGAGKCDIFFKLSLLDREGKVMEYGVRNRAEAKGSILYGKNLTVEIPLHKELPNEVPSEMGLKDINPEDIGGVSIRLDDQSL